MDEMLVGPPLVDGSDIRRAIEYYAEKGWTVRLYYNPLAPLIWLGAALCALGGFVSLSDRRLRIGAPRRSRAAAQPAE